ncbi:MAG: DNA ligase [Deltaproteobacteria bacterium]|nr:MAG: DNA ligase [Deltaproteobacteria bacterium]
MSQSTSIHNLIQRLEAYNTAYRAGTPLVSDEEYDTLVEALRTLDPHHPFLHQVEPEVFTGKQEIRHPVPMLSTDKAYTLGELQRFVQRVHKEAQSLGISPVLFRVTPKLDGLAARDTGQVLVSRGNGLSGFDITSALNKGVEVIGERGQGLGEIVISLSYFHNHLADHFEHPRNLVVGIVASDTVNALARQALDDKAVRFVPYTTLAVWQGTGQELVEHLQTIKHDLQTDIDYPIDGLVAEVIHQDIKESMGATSHHYRWQIAIKEKGATARTTVQNILWQVGRTGKVTPVMLVTPVSLSGATIKRVTAHNAGFLEKRRIGKGSIIEIIRSGEVIPKLEAVITESDKEVLPTICPVCSTRLAVRNDFLLCPNQHCPAQVRQGLEHWFKTLGNADWYGTQTLAKLVANNIHTLEQLYALTEKNFTDMGFGPVQSRNLFQALTISRTKAVEDWRFLAAFGIPDLGKSDSRNLLEHHPLKAITSISSEDIRRIKGFGDITSQSIAQGIHRLAPTIENMLALGFNLEPTPLVTKQGDMDSPLTDKGIVFTGKMQQGTRQEMQRIARAQGAKIQTRVSGTTDYLVCGKKVGATKKAQATRLGTTILTEQEFLDMIVKH